MVKKKSNEKPLTKGTVKAIIQGLYDPNDINISNYDCLVSLVARLCANGDTTAAASMIGHWRKEKLDLLIHNYIIDKENGIEDYEGDYDIRRYIVRNRIRLEDYKKNEDKWNEYTGTD